MSSSCLTVASRYNCEGRKPLNLKDTIMTDASQSQNIWFHKRRKQFFRYRIRGGGGGWMNGFRSLTYCSLTPKFENFTQNIFSREFSFGYFWTDTVSKWRGGPSPVLQHLFRNSETFRPPSLHVPPHPPVISLLCPQQNTQKNNGRKNLDLIHFDCVVAWDYLCSYASTSHVHTQRIRHKSRNTHMQHTVAVLNRPYSAIGWKIGSISNSKVRCVLI